MKRVVILGGGFGGLYTDMYLEKLVGKDVGLVEVCSAIIEGDIPGALFELLNGLKGLF